MEVKEILKNKGPKVWSVQSDDTIRDAITTLVKNKIGALLVFDKKDKMVGIISERDIMRECYNSPEQYASTPVEKVMTKNVIIGKPEDKSDYIMGIMTQNRVRHIPIIADGKLHGMVSIGDVVKAQLQDSQYQIQYLKDYIGG